jgi:hypothetical protein
VRRTVLLTIALCAVLARPAGAWVETAAYDAPGGAPADCLRAAGPGRLSLLAPVTRASTPLDLLALSADGGSLAPVAHTDLGWLTECPALATAPGAEPLLVGPVRGSGLRFAAAGARPADVPGEAVGVSRVAAAAAPGGAAVVAWAEWPHRLAPIRLHVAVRPPGGAGFGPPQLLDDDAADAEPAVGIDAAGRATVAWLHASPRPAALAVARLASAPAGGRFGPPQTLGRTWGEHVAVAVAPNGRALVAAEAMPHMRAYERLPGATRFAPIHLTGGGDAEELAVALADDGGAVIAYRNDATSVFALTRAPGGAFRASTIVPVDRGGGSNSFIAFAVRTPGGRPAPPPDAAAGDLAAALGPGGTVLLTWVDDAADGAAASARAARGTLAGGFERPSRLGSPCRSAAAAQPLSLLDGGLGVAWTDDARVRELGGSTTMRGDGRVHVALPAAPAGAPQPPAAPVLTARLADARALGAAQPLRVRVACRAACDVRASATARSLPQPRWGLGGGGSGGEPLALSASTALRAGGSAVLALRPFAGYDAAGVRGHAQTPIDVVACTPSGPVAQRVRLAPPPIRRPRPVPRVLDLTARRLADGSVRVTWRTSIPARAVRFTVIGLVHARGPVTRTVQRRGRGRTRFAVTLPPPRAGRLRVVYLDLRQPEVLFGLTHVRVGPTHSSRPGRRRPSGSVRRRLRRS